MHDLEHALYLFADRLRKAGVDTRFIAEVQALASAAGPYRPPSAEIDGRMATQLNQIWAKRYKPLIPRWDDEPIA